MSWGSGDRALPQLRGIFASSSSTPHGLAEQNVNYPPSEQDLQQISALMTNVRPAMVLVVLCADPSKRCAAVVFNLAYREKWNAPVSVVCPAPEPGEVERLLRLGAAEVFKTLSDAGERIICLLSSAEPVAEENPIVARLRARLGFSQMVGESAPFLAVLKQIPLIAKYDVCALILGETGAGKEVFARAIHYHSARSTKPFVPVNCGAIPVDLVENEFFGHESGAFTSASSSRRGVIQEAEGGTLFLDEVDCLPGLAQVKLLRFLQDGHFRPLGSERLCKANVRVIAASNIDLRSAQESGRFRKDLYYRLDVVSLNLPPLRERGEDILLLARHFLAKYTAKFGTAAREFSPEALQKLVCHNWPGNVRELENVMQRAVVIAELTIITAHDICMGQTCSPQNDRSFRGLKAKAIEEFERSYVHRLLMIHEGNITKAAQFAGKDRRAFWELMRKHKIEAGAPSSSKAN